MMIFIKFLCFYDRDPTSQPSRQPLHRPTRQPNMRPSIQPTIQPTKYPSSQPQNIPTRFPSSCPSFQPSRLPSSQPSSQPTFQPSTQPSLDPIFQPTSQPTFQPVYKPSIQPMHVPTLQPSRQPSRKPSVRPSLQPVFFPSIQPTRNPSRQPVIKPSKQPSKQPFYLPSIQPSLQPRRKPTAQPIRKPSKQPTSQPFAFPSRKPRRTPSSQPSYHPTYQPITIPSLHPSIQPSVQPLQNPRSRPSMHPTLHPSEQPILRPSQQPSSQPTLRPLRKPSAQPFKQPTTWPSTRPVMQPSTKPSLVPSTNPTNLPSRQPSRQPTRQPLKQPTRQPTKQPFLKVPSLQPSLQPTSQPSRQPYRRPTRLPTIKPSHQPSYQPLLKPTRQPSRQPSKQPFRRPTMQPLSRPSFQPFLHPSTRPSNQPIFCPSNQPINSPSQQPVNRPSSQPSRKPFLKPSQQPLEYPSCQPSHCPSRQPSILPSAKPSHQPSIIPFYRPSNQPFTQPTKQPRSRPTRVPHCYPTKQPLKRPSRQPIIKPTNQPTHQPLLNPSNRPSRLPIVNPTNQPSKQPVRNKPSKQPKSTPSLQPSRIPSMQPRNYKPSFQPTRQPLTLPAAFPTMQPSDSPSTYPTTLPTSQPFICPSGDPSTCPSLQPILFPVSMPSTQPTLFPVSTPSTKPSISPAIRPSSQPSFWPINMPRPTPSSQPTHQPSRFPSAKPSRFPVAKPSSHPSKIPFSHPSSTPSLQPFLFPTLIPSIQPIDQPTSMPFSYPSSYPSALPMTISLVPSSSPSSNPTHFEVLTSLVPSSEPNQNEYSIHPTQTQSSTIPINSHSTSSPIPNGRPSNKPSFKIYLHPSSQPSIEPRVSPSLKPSLSPSLFPSKSPLCRPSSNPTIVPTTQSVKHPTSLPSFQPSLQPTSCPSSLPSYHPKLTPSTQPRRHPTLQPFRCPTFHPSKQPFWRPSVQPTIQPIRAPSRQPRKNPTTQPSRQPSHQPNIHPSNFPTLRPSNFPTLHPTHQHTINPTIKPSSRPSLQPRRFPSISPSKHPKSKPSKQPNRRPTNQPSFKPSIQPLLRPSIQPYHHPSTQPSFRPYKKPSSHPSMKPTIFPSPQPTLQPSHQPNNSPSRFPSKQPANKPSIQPTQKPVQKPSKQPVRKPSTQPKRRPSGQPTKQPSKQPSKQPFSCPSKQPGRRPTQQPIRLNPSIHPTRQPYDRPSFQPNIFPSSNPSCCPSNLPSKQPSKQPTSQPTRQPSKYPLVHPTSQPLKKPSAQPTRQPRKFPTSQPFKIPTMQPLNKHPSIQPSLQPVRHPSLQATTFPSTQPIRRPSVEPSTHPTFQSTNQPIIEPSVYPSNQPVARPSVYPHGLPTHQPSTQPTETPLRHPSIYPSSQPTKRPKSKPSVQPSLHPSHLPSRQPRNKPSSQPFNRPVASPTTQPSYRPNVSPSSRPFAHPSCQPSEKPWKCPSSRPTCSPSCQPTCKPKRRPTVQPSKRPTTQPTANPSFQPSPQPIRQPTTKPSHYPSKQPSKQPILYPSQQPSIRPTMNPSNQPSLRPSEQHTENPSTKPSSQPLVVPSSQSSGIPSQHPTMYPVSNPTIVPVSTPTCQPLSSPTSQPSWFPKILPSEQPFIQPTVKPSSQPMERPVHGPSHQPTVQPIVVPTSRPFYQPTMQPDVHPSTQPFFKPSIKPSPQPIFNPSQQPSVEPKAHPSRTPDMIPTSRPNNNPSNQPTHCPSLFPSCKPSISPSEQGFVPPSASPSQRPSLQPSQKLFSTPTRQPSMTPSIIPLAIPSSQPFQQPSHQPINRPRIQPSKQPSSQPRKRPSLQPRKQPSVQPFNCPSVQPTKQPSLQPNAVPSLQPKIQLKIFISRNPSLKTFWNPTYIPVLSNLTTRPMAGFSCSATLMPTENYQQSQTPIYSPFTNTPSLPVQLKQTSLPTPFSTKLPTMRSFSPSGVAITGLPTTKPVYPSNISFTPSQIPAKTPKTSNRTEQPTAAKSLSPLNSLVTSYFPTGSRTESPLAKNDYPQFTSTMAINVFSTAIKVFVNISNSGYFSCAAIEQGSKQPQSVAEILYASSQQSTSTYDKLTATCELSNVNPLTSYSIYCFTQSFSGGLMKFQDILKNVFVVRTNCCKSIVYNNFIGVLPPYSYFGDENVFQFTLTAKPATQIYVAVSVYRTTCVAPGSGAFTNSSYANVTVSPPVFKFYRNGKSFSGNFVVRGAPGCYFVKLGCVNSSEYGNPLINVLKISNAILPLQVYSVPGVSNVSFSNDGLSILIAFNTSTNRGWDVLKSSIYEPFSCSRVVFFLGSDNSYCVWQSTALLIAHLPSTAVFALNPGNLAVFRPNIIKRECKSSQNCSQFHSLGSISKVIQPPAQPRVPIVIISTPTLVSLCSDIIIDATGSSGQVGRKWSKISWSVTCEGSCNTVDKIYNFLVASSVQDGISKLIVIPTQYLRPGDAYTFRLELTNFFRQSASAQATVRVQNSQSLNVVISGIQSRYLFNWQELNLFAVTNIYGCSGNDSFPRHLMFEWAVFDNGIYLPSLNSTSRDPRYFKLSAYFLEVLHLYTFQVSVYNLNGPRSVYASNNVVYQVLKSGIRIIISGGLDQRQSTLSTIIVDASLTRDLNYPAFDSSAVLTFSWQCQTTSPRFGQLCPNFISSNMSILHLNPIGLYNSINVIQVSVNVISITGESLSQSCRITLVRANIPQITVTASQSIYNTADKVILKYNSIAQNKSFLVSWSSPNFSSLAIISKSPLTQLLPFSSSQIFFVINPFYLLPGGSYVFNVAARYLGPENLTDVSSSAYSSVTITINTPPMGGIMEVDPTTGYALNTSFFLSTYQWSDDNLPLSYYMYYYNLNTAERNLVKSNDGVSYVRSILGPGLSLLQYSVTCVAVVADSLQASNNATAAVSVKPSSIELNTRIISSMFTTAYANSDPIAIIQIANAATQILNTVNCSMTIACGSIFRYPCNAVSHTCGLCLPGYVGLNGNFNMPCKRKSSFIVAGGYCSSNNSCVSNICVNNVCKDTLKECANKCSGHGTCVTTDYEGMPIDSCQSANFYCHVQCQCEPGFGGSDCSVDSSTLSNSIAVRESICNNVFRTLRMQDFTSDVLVARANVVIGLLQELNQVNSVALANCTATVLITIVNSFNFACDSSNYQIVANALSSILNFGRTITPTLLKTVLSTLSSFSLSCQSTLTSGESPFEIYTDSYRVSTYISNRALPDRDSVSIPLIPSNSFAKVPQIKLNYSALSTNVGISLTDFSYNFDGAKSKSSVLSVQILVPNRNKMATGQLPNTQRKLQSSVIQPSSYEYTVTLPNFKAMDYTSDASGYKIIRCDIYSQTPYQVLTTCKSGDAPVKLTCPVNSKGQYNVSCPTRYSFPVCKYWNGTIFVQGQHCNVISYSEYNTTCYCIITTNSSISVDIQGNYVSEQKVVAAVYTYVSLFSSYFIADYDQPSTDHVNLGGVILMGCLFSILLLMVLIPLVTKKRNTVNKIKVYTESASLQSRPQKHRSHRRTISSFFEGLLPVGFAEFSRGQWGATGRFLCRRIIVEHPYSLLIRALVIKKDIGIFFWVSLYGQITTLVSVSIIVASVSDPSTYAYCRGLKTEYDCNFHSTATYWTWKTSCQWDNQALQCRQGSFLPSFAPLAIGVALLLAIATVWNRIFHDCVMRVAASFLRHQVLRPSVTAKYWSDEFSAIETKRSRILRCARATKIDMVSSGSIENECEVLKDISCCHLSSQNSVMYRRLRNIVGPARNVSVYEALMERSNTMEVLGMIHQVRMTAQKFSSSLQEGNVEIEKFLMQEFILDLAPVYRHTSLRRILSSDDTTTESLLGPGNYLPTRSTGLYELAYLVFAVIHIVIQNYYIVSVSLHLSSDTEVLFFEVFVALVLADISLLKILRIIFEWTCLRWAFGSFLLHLLKHLFCRSKLILTRESGIMSNAHCAVQYLNPACRAARELVSVPVCRLLLSVSDDDIAFYQNENNLSEFGYFRRFLFNLERLMIRYSRRHGRIVSNELASLGQATLFDLLSLSLALACILLLYILYRVHETTTIVVVSLIALGTCSYIAYSYFQVSLPSGVLTSIQGESDRGESKSSSAVDEFLVKYTGTDSPMVASFQSDRVFQKRVRGNLHLQELVDMDDIGVVMTSKRLKRAGKSSDVEFQSSHNLNLNRTAVEGKAITPRQGRKKRHNRNKVEGPGRKIDELDCESLQEEILSSSNWPLFSSNSDFGAPNIYTNPFSQSILEDNRAPRLGPGSPLK